MKLILCMVSLTYCFCSGRIRSLVTILNKKETPQAYLKYVFSECECCFAIFIVSKLREVFTALKLNIKIKASNLMSGDQFDVRKGPNLKTQFQHAF